MAAKRIDLPTLTEVVDLPGKAGKGRKADAPAPAEGQPPGPDEAVALESHSLDSLRLDVQAPNEPRWPLQPPAPPSPSAAALEHDEELVAQVMVRLQPRLEAWIEARVRHALLDLLPVWTESAALSIVRDLRSEMPELLSVALDEVHRHQNDKRRR
jgi:hypothetical protein